MTTKKLEPFAWIVLDEDGGVEYAAAWVEACHEHINDALMNDRLEAATWVVRPAFAEPQTISWIDSCEWNKGNEMTVRGVLAQAADLILTGATVDRVKAIALLQATAKHGIAP